MSGQVRNALGGWEIEIRGASGFFEYRAFGRDLKTDFGMILGSLSRFSGAKHKRAMKKTHVGGPLRQARGQVAAGV
jgi:hypothetical protein